MSFRALLTELYLSYNMLISDECLNILAFILERFYPKTFAEKSSKCGLAIAVVVIVVSLLPLTLTPFSIYSPTRLSLSPQQSSTKAIKSSSSPWDRFLTSNNEERRAGGK